MVHGGMKLIKFLLFLFNFVFWLSGIGLIVFGAVIKIQNSGYINFLGNSFLAAPYMLIVVGCIVAVLGFFGCCGAIRENYCMTMTFAVLLGIIFILELAAGIASYVLKSDLEAQLTIHVQEGMNNYLNNSVEPDLYTKGWDKMQTNFNCCGAMNYTDWFKTKNYNYTVIHLESEIQLTTTSPLNRILPGSCCVKKWKPEELEGPCLVHEAHPEGCIDKLKKWVSENVEIIGGVGCGVAFIQIIGIILSCCFATGLRHEDEYFY